MQYIPEIIIRYSTYLHSPLATYLHSTILNISAGYLDFEVRNREAHQTILKSVIGKINQTVTSQVNKPNLLQMAKNHSPKTFAS